MLGCPLFGGGGGFFLSNPDTRALFMLPFGGKYEEEVLETSDNLFFSLEEEEVGKSSRDFLDGGGLLITALGGLLGVAAAGNDG